MSDAANEFQKKEDLKAEVTARMVEVLQSPYASQINFSAFGFSISGQIVYPTIAKELMTQVDSSEHSTTIRAVYLYKPETVSAEVAASYLPNLNEFWFPQNINTDSRNWKATVIHEATHAWCDRCRAGNIGIFESEAIAYIAQHIYSIKIGLKSQKSTNKINKIARVIAKDIVKQKSVSEESFKKLIDRISKTPHYINIKKVRGDNKQVYDG